MTRARPWLAWALVLACGADGLTQQVPDPGFHPPIAQPAFASGQGPVVAIDEAHHNFHTAAGRYQAFVALLRRDGFIVRPSTATFAPDTLQGARLLVIANALHPRNARDWSKPTPSAFTPAEIGALKDWVRAGGALLLIADHMPFPGAVEALAAAFGFQFSNGFAQVGPAGGPLMFRRADATLTDHDVVRGRSPAEAIDAVATFTGSAFRVPPGATSLLVLPKGAVSLEPEIAWRFDDHTPRTEVSGWSQGAVAQVGRGRIAVFGEAGMFSAQLSGPQKAPMGMNAPGAGQNPQFLLNLVRWLCGAFE